MMVKKLLLPIITIVIIANVMIGFYLILATDRMRLGQEYNPLNILNNAKNFLETITIVSKTEE